ncbi:hypothetical protein JM18_009861, partial [Phytophthora kernoviae]
MIYAIRSTIWATELTPDERKFILVFRDAGLKLSAILEAINHSIGVCHKVIKLRDTPSKPSRRGKPKKVTERDQRSIIRAVSEAGVSAKSVKHALNVDVSVQIVQRLCHSVPWLKFKKVRVGPELLPHHQTAHKKWGDETGWTTTLFLAYTVCVYEE